MKAQSQSSSIRTKPSNRPHKRVTRWTRTLVLRELHGLANARVRAQMAYFGVKVKKAYGISAPLLHALARRIGKDHMLAQELWNSGIHEAQILATFIGEPDKVTARLMEKWARDFDSWDVVDSTCCYLFAWTNLAWHKALPWSRRKGEFQKRAAFSIVACLSYKDKTAPDVRFQKFLDVIEREASDDRNFVRKAVNWALRNIGKRNVNLNVAAIETAERIRKQPSWAARWIAADALRELKSEAVQSRLRRKASRRLS